MNEFIETLRKIIVKTVLDRKLGSSVSPRLADEAQEKIIRIPKGVQKERAQAMAKIKDIAKIKIEHRNEKKLREILEERGLKKKKPVDPLNPKKSPTLQINHKVPKKKEESEKDKQ